MSKLPRVSAYSNVDKLNMEMQNRPDLMKRFKHKPFSTDKTDDFKEIFEEELKMRRVTTNYKGTKITGNTAAEVIFEVKRLMDKENHQNHVIRR